MQQLLLTTIFFVSDAGAAADFYADKLGFAVNWRYEDNGSTPAARQARRLLALAQHAAAGQSRQGAIYRAFGEAGYDALRADFLAKGVALTGGWWGMRLMIVEDPDGNQLWFADPHHQGGPYSRRET